MTRLIRVTMDDGGFAGDVDWAKPSVVCVMGKWFSAYIYLFFNCCRSRLDGKMRRDSSPGAGRFQQQSLRGHQFRRRD